MDPRSVSARMVMGMESELNVRSKQRDLIDAKLREYAKCGVAFHHAGLDINDRRAVEQMFIDGGLKLIVSTSVRPHKQGP
jgi:replicative superfamily II helicase